MAIWYENFSLDHVIKLRNNNLNKHLGIEFQKIGDDYISAKMPVDEKTMQSRGVLHGGASCVLAESLGSIASNLCIDMRRQKAVGLEINANHLRPVSSGYVTGITKPISLGKCIHVWSIEIRNEADKICCISRHTTAIINLSDTESKDNIELLKRIFE